jgi:rod shape-determining protein MreB
MQPKGKIVDIGGGTTEIAVIALGGIMWQISKIAGDVFTNDIVYYMRTNTTYLLEKVQLKNKNPNWAAIEDRNSSRRHVCSRRDLLTGKPKQVEYREIAKH